MSKVIDQKVVEMKFDNRDFEKKTSETLSTLDKLREKLKLTGASKGIEEVSTAASKVNFNPMSKAIETVHAKFTALEVMGMTALANITNSAVNAGKRIVSALTIDPVKTGFSEYETQIGAIQTILANTESKGTTLQDVNSALDTLNTYADKTIYNFTEMTRNIGTFTAAGVDLKTSVSSIQGIANLAAVSGSTSQQASVAMYQLSQALSSGTVKLMDWNSVVNAGMGGQVFQDALKRTAKNMGVNVDAIIKKNGSFRESLQEGWVTSKVLTETLSQFTMAAEEGTEEWNNYKKALRDKGYTEEQALSILKMANTATDAATKVKTFTQLFDTLKESAQSGWTQTWEIIVGDFGEAKEFLTSMSDSIGGMIGAMSDARNKLLEGGLSTGWKQLLGAGIADEEGFKETLTNVAKDAKVSIEDIRKTLGDDATFEDALKAGLKDGSITTDMFSESVHKMAEKMGNMTAKQRDAAGYTVEHVTQIKKLSAGLKDGSISMDEFVKKIQRPSGRENILEALTNAGKALVAVFKPIKEAFREIFPAMQAEQLYNFTVALKDFTAKLILTEEKSKWLKSTFKGLFAVLDIGWTLIKEVTKAVWDLSKYLVDLASGALEITGSWGDWLSGLRDTVKETGVFGTVIGGATKLVSKFFDILKPVGEFLKTKFMAPGWENFLDILKGIWAIASKVGRVVLGVGKAIGESLTSAFRSGDMKAGLDLVNGGIFTAILLGIKKFIKDVGGAFDGISGILDGVQGCLESWQTSLKADALKKIATAIGILAVSLLIIASIKSEKLFSSLSAITALFADLMGTMIVFNSMGAFKFKGVTKAVTTMIGISLAVLVLSSALKKISSLGWEELGRGLTGVFVAMGILILGLAAIDSIGGESKTITKGAGQMIKMSLALIVLGGALKILASMSWQELGRGLAAMGISLGILVVMLGIMSTISSESKMATKGSGQILKLSFTLIVLSGALKLLANMSWKELGRGLTAMALSLGILVVMLGVMSTIGTESKMALKGSNQIIKMAIGMTILAGALKILASMSWEDLGRALGAMAIALASFVVILGIMSTIKGSAVASASSLILVSIAIGMLVPSIALLGSMKWSTIKKGLLAIAGALTILCVAAGLIKAAGLVQAVLSISASFALIGVGCVAAGAGIILIAAGITALATAVSAGATVIVAGLSVIVMGFITLLGDIIIGICEGISNSASAIGNTLITLVYVLVDVFMKCIPKIITGAMTIIDSVLEALIKNGPAIIDKLFKFLIIVIEGLGRNLPTLIQAVVNVLNQLFIGVINALKSVNLETIITGLAGVGLIAAMMGALAALAPLTGGAMLGVLGVTAVLAEIGLIAQIPGLTWLVGEGAKLMGNIGKVLGSFVGNLIGSLGEGLTNSLPKIATNLSEFMTNLKPFLDGAKTIDASMLEGVTTITSIILKLTAANLLEGITSFLTGGSSIAKFGTELVSFGKSLKDYSTAVTGIDAEAVKASAEAGKNLALMADTVPNEGGVVGWFAGENSIAKFGTELVTFGVSLAQYASAVAGIDAGAVKTSAEAGLALAKMADKVPNEGGVAAWFAGDNSLAKFGPQIASFGKHLKSFAKETTGLDTAAVKNSADAALSLARMADTIPNQGGVVAWFGGDNSLSKFGGEIADFGKDLKEFGDNVKGITPETVSAAAEAGKSLAKMADTVPNEGGIKAWFVGDNSRSKFGPNIASFGKHLKKFGDNVAGIEPETIKAAAEAGKSLAKMANTVPNEGGIKAWFSGDNSLSKFGPKLAEFGKSLKKFGNNVNGIVPENVKAAASASKTLAEMTKTVPEKTDKIKSFGSNVAKFGSSMKLFATEVEGINAEELLKTVKYFKDIANQFKKIADKAIDGFVSAFENSTFRIQYAINNFAATAYLALKADSIFAGFKNGGSYCVDGFVAGISQNTFKATAQATAMAKAALQAAENELQIKSPSRAFYKVGDFAGQGFVNALSDSTVYSYRAGQSMAESARDGLSKAISRVSDLIDTDMDTQPTIRPVLDLSNVESGAGRISSMFDNPSIGVMSNLRSISSGMNAKIQNGSNNDVVAALNKLRSDLGNIGGNTYNINGITYDDGSNINNAVESIVRAAVMERRV